MRKGGDTHAGSGTIQVRLLPHDERWHDEFLTVRARIQELWNKAAVDIRHFGSTAIHGIWAKPILDIAVVVKSFDVMDTEAMKRAGYDDSGLRDPDRSRHLFVPRGEKPADFRRCVGFRDDLNSHPEAAQAYSGLKRKLAEKYLGDRFACTDAKWEFIQSIYHALSPSDQAVSGK